LPIESTNIQDAYQDKYEKFSEEDKSLIHQLFFDPETKENIKTALKHIIFKIIPPTPEEFLDPEKGFLPESYIASLFPHVKRDFVAAMQPDNPYNIISIYGSTRTGKSVLARLFVTYSLIYINYLRDPHFFYNVGQWTKLCIYLVSFNDAKTRQIYLSPILEILDASGKFKRERFELNVKKRGVTADGVIHFSEASKFGSITFPKISIVCGRDASSLVGADIVAGVVSELTFFKDFTPGLTDDDVMQVFTKLHSRILNTIGRNSYPAFTYIDSSANWAESPLEKMILQDIRYNPKAFFRWYVLWEVRPDLFPIYYKDRTKTFPVCVGAGDIPAKVIDNPVELETLPKHLIIHAPIDVEADFRLKLIDQLKDCAGYPTSNESKLIQDSKLIKNIFNNETLTNIEGALIANSEENPEQLLWKQICNIFYSCYDNEHWIIKRAQGERRYFCMDNSFAYKGDALGVCCLHKELRQSDNQIMYVCDFNFVIVSSKGQEINLEAFPQLIINMMTIGQTPIGVVVADSFQSKPLLQHLERNKINAVTQSVDRDIAPYQFLLTTLFLNTFKAGKNIFLKNNLDSLYRTVRASGSAKIDHSNGGKNNNYFGGFEESDCGKNAKDASDAACSALWAAYSDNNYFPSVIYEQENQRFSNTKESMDLNIKNAYNKLHRGY